MSCAARQANCSVSGAACTRVGGFAAIAAHARSRGERPNPWMLFQTCVLDRQGLSRDFQIRAALSLRDRGPATMPAEMLAATVTPNHRSARLLLCLLRFKDVKRPTTRVRRPRLAGEQCFRACHPIPPALACLALFAFVRWTDSCPG
jgi:hypothetical protein